MDRGTPSCSHEMHRLPDSEPARRAAVPLVGISNTVENVTHVRDRAQTERAPIFANADRISEIAFPKSKIAKKDAHRRP